MSKFRAPDSFDFGQPAHWEEWITRWTRFRAITKLETETEEIQVSSLLYTIGPQSETVLNALRLSADDQKHYETVLAALNAYFKPKKYVIFERARFYRRNQMTGEPAEQLCFPVPNPLSPFLTNSRFYVFLIHRCLHYLPTSSPDWSCGPKSSNSCFAHDSGRPFQCK